MAFLKIKAASCLLAVTCESTHHVWGRYLRLWNRYMSKTDTYKANACISNSDFILALYHDIKGNVQRYQISLLCIFWEAAQQVCLHRGPNPCSPPLLVCVSSRILCQDMGFIRGSQSVPGGALTMGTDGSQLLKDICFLWVTPSVPDAEQNGWWTTHHIHLSSSEGQ